MKPPSETAVSLGKDHYFSKYWDRLEKYPEIPEILKSTIKEDEEGYSIFWSGIIEWHRRPGPPRSATDDGWCCGSVQFVGWKGPTWEVESLDPLTLSPSILCVPEYGGCGNHGYIKAGAWSDA